MRVNKLRPVKFITLLLFGIVFNLVYTSTIIKYKLKSKYVLQLFNSIDVPCLFIIKILILNNSMKMKNIDTIIYKDKINIFRLLVNIE